jgi:hypothetical protein
VYRSGVPRSRRRQAEPCSFPETEERAAYLSNHQTLSSCNNHRLKVNTRPPTDPFDNSTDHTTCKLNHNVNIAAMSKREKVSKSCRDGHTQQYSASTRTDTSCSSSPRNSPSDHPWELHVDFGPLLLSPQHHHRPYGLVPLRETSRPQRGHLSPTSI